MTSSSRPSFRKTCLVVLMLATYANSVVLAAPLGGHAVSGTANFQQNGNLTTITAGNRSVINYSSFNIAPNETVRFVQPGPTSTVLNRVLDPNPTNIFGRLESNGIITIANPYGVFFQNGSVINVGGLYAGAGNISTADFTAGRIHFTDLKGDVRNDGVLAAQNQIALMGANVTNNGTMTSTRGLAMMVSGSDVYVGQRNSNIFVQANGRPSSSAASSGSITNNGTVAAPRVLMGAGDMYSTAIVNTGLLQGRSIQVNAGRNGTATVGGKLDASSARGTGGSVQITGGTVALRGATVDASGNKGGGSVRVGGDFHGGGTLSHSNTTTVDAATTIRADATGTTGNGGTVVLWSDRTTVFSGNISARGGSAGGDGGRVEISSNGTLGFYGLADLTAPAGKIGSLLLDPHNITISDATADPDPTVYEPNPSDPAGVRVPFNGITLAGPPPSVTEGPATDININATALGNQLGAANVTLQANNDITFVNNVTGATLTGGNGNLTLQAGRSIIFNAGVTLTLQGSLTATFNDSGATVTNRDVLPAAQAAAVFTMNTGSGITAPGGVTITGGTFGGATVGTLTGAVTLNNITTSSGTAGTASGAISVTNNVAAGKDITVNGGLVTTPLGAAANTAAGNVTLNSTGTTTVGGIASAGTGTGAGGTVSLTGSTAVNINGPVVAGSLTTSNGAPVGLNGGSVTTTGNQTYGGTVTLGAAGNQTTLTGATLTPGILINGGGTQSLTLAFTNAPSLAGGTAATAGRITLNNLNNLTVGGGGATFLGDLTTVGFQNYTAALTLGADVILSSSTGGAISFTAIDSDAAATPRLLTVNTSGATTFGGAVGSGNALSGLKTTGTGGVTISGGSVKTAGNGQSYLGAVTLNSLGGTTTLTDTANGAILFQNALDGATAGTQALTLSTGGAQTFTGAVGTTALASLSTTGTGAVNINGGAVTTSGATGQVYTGAVTLGAAGLTTLTANGNGSIFFGATVDGTAANAQNLTLVTAGLQTFTGRVGTAALPLAGLTAGTGPISLNGGAVTTNGATGQNYNGAVTLGLAGGTTAAPVTTTLTSNGGPINFASTVEGLTANTQALVLTGASTQTLGGTVGATNALASLSTGTVNLNGGTVRTYGAQTYLGPVTLGIAGATPAAPATTTLLSLNGGEINFHGAVNGLAATGAGAQALVLDTTGNEVFAGLVGSTLALASLTTDPTMVGGQVQFNAAGTEANPSVKTTGAQTYNDAVVLSANTAFNASTLAFNSTFTGGGFDVVFTLSGTAVVSGNLAGIKNFTSDGTGTTQVGGTFATTGSQTYGNPVTLTAATILTSGGGGNITFNSTVKGAFTLTLNPAGTAVFGGVVGGVVGSTDNLASLTVNGNTVTTTGGTAITTSGLQQYTGSLTLGAPLTLTSTANSVTVGSLNGSTNRFGLTVSALSSSFGTITNGGNLNFTVGAGTGAVFTGTVDATSLTVAGGKTTLNGGSVTTNSVTLGQSYGALSLGVNTTLTDNASGPITFNGTVDGIAPGAQSLTVLTNGATTFGGLVGSTNPLGSLTVGGTAFNLGTTVFNAGGVTVATLNNGTATGLQTYNNSVRLGLDTTLASTFVGPATAGGNITFNGAVDSATATQRALVVNTSANEIFNGLVGNLHPLLSLATDTTGNVGGSVQFNMSLVGQPANTAGVNLGNGGLQTKDLAIFNVLGSSSAKVPASVSGTAGTNNPSITSTGNQNYQGGVTDQQNTVIQGPGIAVTGTFDAGNKALTFDLSNQVITLPLTGTTFINLASLASVGNAGTILNGNITTPGYQYYGGTGATAGVTLGNNVTLTSSGGAVIGFGGTVDGAFNLIVNTAGDEQFNGLIGNTTPLTSLQTDAAGTVGGTARFNMDVTGLAPGKAGVAANSVLIGDAVAFNVTGTVPGTAATAVSSVRSSNQQVYSGAATLGQDTVLTDTGTTIKFLSTVDGTRNLTLNLAGQGTFQNRVGGINPLLGLTTNGGTVIFAFAGTTAAPSVTTVNNVAPGGTATGGQTYNSAVALAADTVLSSTFVGPATAGGAIVFNGTVDGLTGPQNLTVLAGPGQTVFAPGATVNAAALNIGGAQVTFNAAVGSLHPLNVLTVGSNGTLAGVVPSVDINNPLISTTLGQTYTDPVFLSADATLKDTNAHNIAFNSTVDSLDATPRTLTLSTTGAGTITFNAPVGSVHALGALTATTVTGGTFFNMTLTGTSPGVTVGTGGVTVTGPVTFGIVGSTSARPSILTTGPQIYQSTVPALETADTVLRGTTLTIPGGINGQGHDLLLDFSAGPVVVNAFFTGIKNFSSVGNGGTQLNLGGGTFTTTGVQLYGNAVTLTSDSTLNSTNNNITFASTLNGPFNLVLQPGTATVFLNGAVGGTPATDLASLAVFGNTNLSGGSVRTSGAQAYLGTLTLANNTTLTSTGGGQIAANSLAGGGFDLTVNALTTNFGTITNGGNLLFNVGTGVGANFSSTVDALSLRVTGGKADLAGNVTTNSVTLGQNYAQLQLNGSVTLTDNAGGPITSGVINGSGAGGQNLTLGTSGLITFNGAVGSLLPLGSLTTGGGGTTIFNVTGGASVTTVANGTTTGAQNYNEAVVLDQDTALFTLASGTATNAGAVVFNGTVDSASAAAPASLTILAGNGQTVFAPGATVNANALNIGGARVTFNQPVGSIAKLDVLTVGRSGVYTTGTNTIDLNGGSVTSTLGQTYNDPVTLSADTMLNDTNGGNIAFNTPINSDAAATPRSLTLSTTGAVVLGGVIGNAFPLSGLSVTANGGTTFQMNFTGQPAGVAGVNVGAGGVTINGPATFAVPGSSLLDLSHVTVLSAGAQAYNGPVSLALDASFRSTNGGVGFNGTVNGPAGLAVNASGNVVFGGIVGGVTPLASLTTGTLVASTGQTQFNANLAGQSAGIAGVRVGAGGITVNNPVLFNVTGATVANPSVETFNGGTQTYGGAASVAANTVLVGDASGATPPAGGGYVGGGAILFGSTVAGTGGTPNLSIYTGTGPTVFQSSVDVGLLNVTGAKVTFNGAVSGLGTLFILSNGAAGGPITLNGGTTAGYTVRTTAGQTYNSALVLGADTILTNGTANANLVFGSTVDGAHTLTLTTAGRIIFNGLVGSAAPLTGLTTNSAATPGLGTEFDMSVGGAVAGVVVNGPVVVNDPVTFNVGGSSLTQPSILTLGNNPQTYNGAVNLSANTVLVTAAGFGAGGMYTGGGAINLLSAAGVTGAAGNSLSIRAGAGLTTLSGAINVASLDLGGGQVTVNGPITLPGGNLSVEPNNASPANAVQFNGGALTTAGAQTYNVAFTLGGNTTLTSLNTAGDGGNITFVSTVNGPFALTVNTPGDEVFNGVIGGNVALASLTTDAAGIVGGAARFNMNLASAPGVLAGVNTTGAVTINDGVVFNVTGVNLASGGQFSVASGGAQRYVGAATLLQDTALVGTGAAGDIAFVSTVDGARGLLLVSSGVKSFGGVVGGTTALTSLTTNLGTTVFNISLGATFAGPAAVRIDGPVNLNGPADFNINATNAASPTSVVLIGGPLNIAGTANFNLSLVNTPNTESAMRINGALTVNGTANFNVSLAGAGSAGSAVLVNGPLNIAQAANFNFNLADAANAGSALQVNGPLSVGGAANFSFSLAGAPNAGSAVRVNGDLTIGGTTFFNVTSNTSAQPAVLTLGDFAQTYNGAVTLGKDTGLSSAGAGAINFASTVDGFGALLLSTNGVTTFAGAVGGTTPLAGLSGATGLTQINGGSVTTQFTQTYNGAVTLGQDTVLTSLDGPLGIASGGNGGVLLNGTVDGAHALTINASELVILGGAVGAGTPLSSLQIVMGPTGKTLLNGGLVTTVGRQTYGGGIILGADATVRSLGTAGADSTITFQSFVDGGVGLTVNTPGNVFFNGPVGSALPLSSLTTNAQTTTVAGGQVTTTNSQTYNGAVRLSAATVLNNTNGAGGGITFSNTLDGAFALTLNTGAPIVFNAPVGDNAALASLTTQGGGLTTVAGGRVTTTGAQNYGNPVLLAANGTFTGSGVAFRGAVDGGYNLGINTTGQAFFGGLVGGNTPLAQVTTSPGSTTVFDHSGVTTTGLQTYGGTVFLNTDTALTSKADKDITFANTVNGLNALTINTNGNTIFNGAVGDDVPLSSLTVASGGGTTVFNSAGARTTGAQTYNNAVTLSPEAVSFTSDNGALTFGKTVDAASAGGTALTLSTTGVSAFNGNVGAANSLASLLVTGPLAIGGQRVVTVGDQRYVGQVAANPLASPDTQLTTTGLGNIRFDGMVTAGGSLVVSADRVGAQRDIITTGDLVLDSRNAVSPLLLLLGNNYISTGGVVRFNTQQAYDPSGSLDNNATIILGNAGTTTILGTGFKMGLNQKLLSLGTLTINVAGGTATVGDLAAKNTLTIRAGTVVLQDRQPGSVATLGGRNNGLNFVAPNGISFGGAAIIFAGTGNRSASFVTANGNVDIIRVQGVSLFKDQTVATQFPATAPSLDELANPPSIPTEPVAGGTQSLDTAAALSGALPDQKPVDVAADITISASQMEQLKKLGIHPRLAQKSERGSAASKRALFAQLVDGQDQENYGRLQPIKGGVSRLEPSDYVVVVDRMGEREVRSILSSFENLYGKNKEKAPEIGGSFQTAFNDYTVAKQTADPAGFADYLSGQKGKYPAVDTAVRGFDDLFGHIEHLGLTNKEVAKSEEHIASDLGVSGVSPEDMVKTINALRKKLPPAQKAASTKAPPSAPAANPASASASSKPTPVPTKPATAVSKPTPAPAESIPEIMPSLPPMVETPEATPPAPAPTPAATPAPTPAVTPAPSAAPPLSVQNTTRRPDTARKTARQEKKLARPAHRASADGR